MPRAGSTLLRLLLDTHSEIYAPDELRLGRLCHALFGTLEGLSEAGGLDAGRRARLDTSPGVLAETRGIASGLLSAAAGAKGKRMWCEKSPENLEYLAVLEQVFPDALAILLHRHCLDVVASCLRAGRYGFNLMVVGRYLSGHHQNFVVPLVQAWVEEVGRLLDFEERHAPRCFRLRYEDLVAHPRSRLDSLCRFLGVGPEPEIVDRVFNTPHHQRLNAGDGNAIFSTTITADGVGRGREIPWERVRSVPEDLFDAMNRTLVRLGYPPVEDASWDYGVEIRSESRQKQAPDSSLGARELLEGRLPARLASGTPVALAGSLFTFVVTGEGGGTWLLDLTGEPGRVVPGAEPAGLEIHLAGSDLVAIASEGGNPAVAYREGKVQINGGVLDLESLRALVSLLSPTTP